MAGMDELTDVRFYFVTMEPVTVLDESPFVTHFVPLIAYPIPILEVLVGLALLIPSTRRVGFIASLILMVAFTLYNIYLLWFAPDVPCGCGGIFKDMSWTAHLFVNIGLTILAGLGIYLSAKDSGLRAAFSSWKNSYTHIRKRRSIGT